MNHKSSTHDNSSAVYGMPPFEQRTMAIDEVHARPYLLIEPPRRLVQLVFMNDGVLIDDRETMDSFPEQSDSSLSDPDSLFHGLTWEQGKLHCEKHAEFSTYLWSGQLNPETGDALGIDPFKDGFEPPGAALCGIQLDVLPWSEENTKQIDYFDTTTLCHSTVEGGLAEIATDFRQDDEGLTRILVLDRGVTPPRLGALIQRLMEIETYRTLALLGSPTSRDLVPRVRAAEKRLTEITEEMRTSARSDSQKLLSKLTDLSAELEADSAAILYRFSASRNYYEILRERLAELNETPVSGSTSWRDFLHRRIAPAMRTCRSVEERLNDLSKKLGHAISLLSTWMDVQLERQNGDLLTSMNNRARVQLQMQHTVEGLSVAAISYYVVGLLGYLVKGIPFLHDLMKPELTIALLIPFVVLANWWVVRRIRLSHSDEKERH